MSKQVTYSPSNSDIWTNCPGSVSFCNSLDLTETDKDTDHSIDGTRAHSLLSETIRMKLSPQKLLTGNTYKDKHGEWQPDQDMLDAVGFAYDHVMARSQEMGVPPLCDENVDPSMFFGATLGEMEGFCDAYIKTPTLLQVFDFKYGMDEVQVSPNTQLVEYAGGILAKYHDINAEMYMPKLIRLSILQPRIGVLGKTPIKSVLFTFQELLDELSIIKERYRLAQQLNALLNAGKWCKHCPALGNCSANNEQSLTVLGHTVSEVVDQSMSYTDATTMTDSNLVKIYLASKQIKQMLVACEVELTKRTHDKPIDGVKLVQGNGSKTWNVSDAELIERLGMLVIPSHVHYTQKIVSPSQALKTKWETKNGTVKINKFQKQGIERMITVNKGKPVLALTNDSREAVQSNVAKLFPKTETDVPTETDAPAWL